MSEPVFKRKQHKQHTMYPVYAHKTALGCRPLFFATGEERKEMLDNGSARSMSRGKALQLLITFEQVRGASCQMGPRVIEAAAFGDGGRARLAKEAALSYLLIAAGSYCPLILST